MSTAMEAPNKKPKTAKLTDHQRAVKELSTTAEGFGRLMRQWATKGQVLRGVDGGPALDDMGRVRYRDLNAQEAKVLSDFLKNHPLTELVRELKSLSSTDRVELEAARRRSVQQQLVDSASGKIASGQLKYREAEPE